jgi:hypothetical protein
MQAHVHPLRELFAQLGLPESGDSIRQFIHSHAPLAPEVDLTEAPFWSDHQKAFLREALRADADWSQVVDSLDTLLRDAPLAPATQPH